MGDLNADKTDLDHIRGSAVDLRTEASKTVGFFAARRLPGIAQSVTSDVVTNEEEGAISIGTGGKKNEQLERPSWRIRYQFPHRETRVQ